MAKHRRMIHTLAISCVVMASLVVSREASAQKPSKEPKNVQLASAAWKAFDDKKYEQAILAADKCVEEFQAQADRDESRLEQQKAPLPPVGKVSKEEKEAIFSQGVVNDVATCLWIKAQSARTLGRNDQATQAYEAACKYRYARAWDPGGWFWSPSQDACDRLQRLKSK